MKVIIINNKNTSVINFLAFSKDGKFLVTRSKNETIIWDCKTWKTLLIIEEDFGIVTSTQRYI